MLLAKNQENRPMSHRVIQKIKVARFLLRHGVDHYHCMHVSLRLTATHIN